MEQRGFLALPTNPGMGDVLLLVSAPLTAMLQAHISAAASFDFNSSLGLSPGVAEPCPY